jgi:hypothetical protein
MKADLDQVNGGNKMDTPQKEKDTSKEQRSEIKCLAECPKCRDEGVQGLCGFDKGHTSEHHCERCDNTWKSAG